MDKKMKPMPKLNKKGTYTEFPGVTVVAPTSTNNLQFWEAIYNFLNQNDNFIVIEKKQILSDLNSFIRSNIVK